MKIEVKPVPRKFWHKKSEKESFTRAKKIQALLNTDTMQYATGLSDDDIKLLTKTSKKDGGFEVKYDLSSDFNNETPHPFWDSPMAVLKLENRTMIFDDDKALDFIRIHLMKASRFVANSFKEWEEGVFPEATHIIFDEREEIEAKATKVAIKKRAYIESAKLSKDKKIQLIMIIANKNLKGKSDNFVEVELDKILESDPKDILRLIERDADEIENYAITLEALQKSVYIKKGHKIMYHSDLIGSEIDDVVKYLGKSENQDHKFRIMEAINK